MQEPQLSKSASRVYGAVFMIVGIIILFIAFGYSLKVIGRIIIGGLGVVALLGSAAFFVNSLPDSSKKGTPLISNLFLFSVGIVIMLIFGYLFFASFDWSWQEQSKHNIYIVYHYDWLKWLFYPITSAAIVIGAWCAYSGIKGPGHQ